MPGAVLGQGSIKVRASNRLIQALQLACASAMFFSSFPRAGWRAGP